MTSLQTYLSETDKLFEEKFVRSCQDGRWTGLEVRGDVSEIKSFLRQRQVGLINLVREEEWKRCVDLLDHDHLNCPIKESCIGYQNAQSDLMNQPPEHIKNLELKDIKIK